MALLCDEKLNEFLRKCRRTYPLAVALSVFHSSLWFTVYRGYITNVKISCMFLVAASCFFSLLPIQAETKTHCCCGSTQDTVHCPNSSPCRTPIQRAPSSRVDADRSAALPLAQSKEYASKRTHTASSNIPRNHPPNDSLPLIALALSNLDTHSRLTRLCSWLT